jgi:NAD(P)H-dependent FMN reductase
MSAKVLLIAGSLREPSYTRAALHAAQAELDKRGATTHEWDLGERPLPIADPEYEGRPQDYPDATVREFARIANEADAFVLASPVYHNSYSGVLKNALDLLGSEQFERKPVGLMAHRGVQPLDHLRLVVRSLRGVAINQQIVTHDEDFERTNGSFHLTSPRIQHRLERFAEELLDYARRFSDD